MDQRTKALEELKAEANAKYERLEKMHKVFKIRLQNGERVEAMDIKSRAEALRSDLELVLRRIKALEYGTGITPLKTNLDGSQSPSSQTSLLQFELDKDE